MEIITSREGDSVTVTLLGKRRDLIQLIDALHAGGNTLAGEYGQLLMTVGNEIARQTQPVQQDRVEASVQSDRRTAVAYLRVGPGSTDSGIALARQRQATERLAASLGVDLVAVFEDVATYADGRGPGSGWAKLLAYITERQPGYLLALSPARLVRHRDHLAKLTEVCAASGTNIRVAVDGQGLRGTYPRT